MGKRFVACDREQSFLMPPDVREWLPEGHFAWFVLQAVAGMDLAAFYAVYRQDGRARPAYEPSMMVALLLYGYARGVRSSRALERACEDQVAYRVIAAQAQPDHATIARFIERHENALAALFGQILALCAEAGLVGVNVVAVDGTKLAANASREQTADYERIAREIIEEAKAVDAAEDELYGEARGDELPPELATGQGRAKWLAEAKRRLEDRRAEEARPIPGPRPKRLKEAKRRLEEELWTEIRANRVYEAAGASGVDRRGRRLGAHQRPKPYTPPAVPQGTINTTDLDSRLMKGHRGWLQAYNAQAAANEQQIVIAAEVTVAAADFGQLEPILEAACSELHAAGVHERPETVLADAGYWHQDQIQRIAAAGTQVLIPPDADQRKGNRPGWNGGLYSFMRHVLDGETGRTLYRRRQQLIEPVFANTKHNRGITRFSRRGRAAVRAEWRLITGTHNLLKLHRHQTATA
jgi:transposase